MKKRLIGRMCILLVLGLVVLTMTVSAVSIIPICTDPNDQGYPAISGDTIVWQDFRSGYADIYKWDPVNKEQRVTTDPENHHSHPAISGDTIVWSDYRYRNSDIYKWDPVSGEKRVTFDPADQREPAISGNTIVWTDYRNGNWDINKWDPVNGRWMTTNTAEQREPAISGNTIVWTDFRNGNFNSDIYKWDEINREQQVTTDSGYQGHPAISGDTIVWSDDRNGNSDIYKWDPVNGEKPVTTNTADQMFPAISGDTIVWTDNRNGNLDIYKWDPVNGEQRVTTNTADQMFPAISGDTIVWTDYRNGNWDIYAAKMTTITVTSPNGWESWARGTTHTVTWDYTGNPGPFVKLILVKGVLNKEVGTIIPSTPTGDGGKGSYTWPIASSGTTGSDFKVKVQSLSKPTINDMSNNYFTLTPVPAQSITVTSPHGGETWQRGTTQTITWEYTGNPGSKVKIGLVMGDVYLGIANDVSIGSNGKGSYTWPIASSGITGSGFKVSVQSISQPTIKGISDKSFALTPATTPSITVTSPNGGETWQRGTPHKVTWSYTELPSGAPVKIVLLKAGAEVGTIIDSTSIGVGGKGSYTWDINSFGSTGSDYKVKISSVNQPTINDTSDNFFTITPATTPSITVTIPNGGETWQRGSTHTVTWDFTGNPGSDVKLTLLRGVSNTEVGTIIPSTPIGNGGKGSYPWDIGTAAGLPTGSDFKVKVQSLSQPTINDTSDNYFTLTSATPPPATPTITVTSPNGGEMWQRGTTHTVTWSYTGNPGSTVKLVLVKAGAEVGTIVSGVSTGTGGTGSYTWPIGSSPALTTGGDFKVRVESLSQPTIQDTSNNVFTLTPAGTATPTITVTTPNGGEIWKRGTTQTVRWSYTGTPGTTVKLVLVKAGTDVGTIIASTPLGTSGTGSFIWPIASSGTTGSDFKLRVESLSQPTINDSSNNIFTLTL